MFKLRLLPLPLFLLFSVADAQPVRPRSPHDVERIIEAVERNVLSSKQDRSLIPISVYYRAIFTSLQTDFSVRVPVDDMRLIQELPSHSNAQFAQQNIAEMNSICADAKTILSEDEGVALADRYELSNRRKEKLLEAHYTSVLSRLSPPTRAHVQAEMMRLSESDELNYATVNMREIAVEIPDLFVSLIKNGCERFTSLGGIRTTEDKRLIDELGDNSPFGTNDIQRVQ